MAYPIEKKLVIAIASSALFDLSESDKIFREKGEEKYRRYQIKYKNKHLNKGVAFPFIKRFLSLNVALKEKPVEVVLLSKNDPETGLRVFNSIKYHKLDISRAVFLTGKSPFEYIPAFNASLFLSANNTDVRNATEAGYPAGTVLETNVSDCNDDCELRVAFDCDGVIVDDKAEAVYQKTRDVKMFHKSEVKKARTPLNPGPLTNLFQKISFLQRAEQKEVEKNHKYRRILRTAIITARNAPAHERVVTTLRDWGVFADETFFLGGIDKGRILQVLKPHIFFDDQLAHLKSAAKIIPSVHIPFGIINKGL